MRKKNNDIFRTQGNVICCSILLLSFLATACHFTSNHNGKPQEKQATAYRFDASRMVNKVLDSTDIAYLYGFGEDGKFPIYRNDFIKKYKVYIRNKKYYLSDDCDSLAPSIEARLGKCWFLEFIRIDSISEDIYRLYYAIPYKCRGGCYDFDIKDYVIVDSFMVIYKAMSDTVRYNIGMMEKKGNLPHEAGN